MATFAQVIVTIASLNANLRHVVSVVAGTKTIVYILQYLHTNHIVII